MTVSEIVAHPTEAVQRLFRQAGCPIASDTDWGVLNYFKEAIAAIGDGEIPHLSEQPTERLPHHSLVRFHGMVQDLLNPEYYVGAFQKPNGGWFTTKFSDPDMSELDNYDNNGQPIVWERRPIVCVPIPGLSKWALPNARRRIAAATHGADAMTAAAGGDQAADHSLAQAQMADRAVGKRDRSSDADAQLDAASELGGGGDEASREDSVQDTDLSDDQGPGPMPSAPSADAADDGVTRRRIRRREDRTVIGVAGGASCLVEISGPAGARDQADGRNDNPPAVQGGGGGGRDVERPSTFDEVPGSCMVYLYDNAPALVLHEVVEIIGVLSHVPQLAALEYDNQDPLLEHDLASLELSGVTAAAVVNEARSDSHHAESTSNRVGERLVLEAMRAAHPPTSKVMRLHAIIVRRDPPLVSPFLDGTPIAFTAAAVSETDPGVSGGIAVTTRDIPAADAMALTRPTADAAVKPLRDLALGLLRCALGGDAVAAEYVLLQLLGRVASRGEPAALGQLTINLCRCPAAVAPATTTATTASSTSPLPTSSPPHSSPPLASEKLGRGCGPLCAALHATISQLAPLSVALPLTVESCNGVSWAPQRDPVRERTRPSPLQLPPGTVVLLDETLMAPGQLKTEGVASMQALMAVARQQQLMYDFESFQHPVPVDLPLIVLTEGRSLLHDSVHVRVPLNSTQAFPAAEDILALANGTAAAPSVSSAAPAAALDTAPAPAADNPKSPGPEDGAKATALAEAANDTRNTATELAAVRSYLAAARTADGYNMADGMSAVLEQYFVDSRRPEGGGGNPMSAAAAGASSAAACLTAEEFHVKLTLARLLVLSYGERQLTRERWQQLLQLEHIRESRLRVVG